MMTDPTPSSHPTNSPHIPNSQLEFQHSILTRHGRVHAIEVPSSRSQPSDQALVLIHGNSSCSLIFKHILASGSSTSSSCRCIAIDLPGHGESENAGIPEKGYTQRGYAEAVVDVLRQLQVREFVVLGWSLGGHIAIEMLALLGHGYGYAEGGNASESGIESLVCKGIMITGTPPGNGAEQVREGFDPSDGVAKPVNTDDDGEHMNYAATAVWPEDVYASFPAEGAGQPYEDWMEAMARRTDGKARQVMWDSFAEGHGVDQRRVLETCSVPCAVVNGAAEPFVNLKAVGRVKYQNLWEGKCYELHDSGTGRGLGHTPFWEDPKGYQPYVDRFVMYCFES